jgi:hypothetical protein
LLLTDKDQNPGRQRQDPHYDSRDGDVKQQSDSDEYQVDSQQEHSEVFGDVHGFCLKQSPSFCTLKIGAENLYGFLLTTFVAYLLIPTSPFTF